MKQVARAGLGTLVVVARDRAAGDHASERTERVQRSLELRAADVVEVHVDPVCERLLGRLLPVVERLDPERAEPVDLLGRSPRCRSPAAPSASRSGPRRCRRRPRRRRRRSSRLPRSRPMSTSPTHAVRPGMPSTPSAVDGGASDASSLRRPSPAATPCSRQPSLDSTQSPCGEARRDAIRRRGRRRRRRSDRRARTGRRRSACRSCGCACTGRPRRRRCERAPRRRPGSASAASRSSKSDSFGSPCGRAARTISRGHRTATPPARRG